MDGNYKWLGESGHQPTRLNNLKNSFNIHPRVEKAITDLSSIKNVKKFAHVSALKEVDQPKYYFGSGIVVENIAANPKGDVKLLIREYKPSSNGIGHTSKPKLVNIPKKTGFSNIQHKISAYMSGHCAVAGQDITELFTNTAKKTLKRI